MWVYKYLFESLLYIYLGYRPEEELVGHVVNLCVAFEAMLFSFMASSAASSAREPISSTSQLHLFSPTFLTVATLMAVISLSLCGFDLIVSNGDVSIFSSCLSAICMYTLENVCSGGLPGCHWVCALSLWPSSGVS